MTTLADYKQGNVAAVEASLPPASGFFFGSTEIDEYYAEDLQNTIDQLEPLLKESDVSFYYQSSW